MNVPLLAQADIPTFSPTHPKNQKSYFPFLAGTKKSRSPFRPRLQLRPPAFRGMGLLAARIK